MSLEDLKQRLPEHARDLKLNLRLLTAPTVLTPEQALLTGLAVAHAVRSAPLLVALEGEAASRLSEAQIRGARVASSLMAMNNIYYRFLHLVENEEYGKLPAGLRMSALGEHGLPTVDFELAALAVSAVHGCGMCVAAHERKLRAAGAAALAVQEAVKLAAILHAVGLVLENEAVLGERPVAG